MSFGRDRIIGNCDGLRACGRCARCHARRNREELPSSFAIRAVASAFAVLRACAGAAP